MRLLIQETAQQAPDIRKALDLIAKGVDFSVRHEDSSPVLILSALKGHDQITLALLEAGAPVNEKNRYNYTALMMAAGCKNAETVRALITAGSSLNEKDIRGYTALIWAAEAGTAEIVETLIDAGADTTPRNDRGISALDAALGRFTPDERIVKLLQETPAERLERQAKRATILSRKVAAAQPIRLRPVKSGVAGRPGGAGP